VEKYKDEIKKYYNQWYLIALALTNNKEQAIDLLHEVLLQVFGSGEKEIMNVRNYVSHSIALSWKSSRSNYHYKYTKVSRSFIELKEEHERSGEKYPSFYLSQFKQTTLNELCQYNGTSTSVLSNAVDHCRRMAIQDMFLGGYNEYNQLSEILQREEA